MSQFGVSVNERANVLAHSMRQHEPLAVRGHIMAKRGNPIGLAVGMLAVMALLFAAGCGSTTGDSANKKMDGDTKSNHKAAPDKSSGFGDYIYKNTSTGDDFEQNETGGTVTYHVVEESESNDLIERTSDFLAKYGDDQDNLFWIKVDVDNQDGSEPMSLQFAEISIVTDDGETIEGTYDPGMFTGEVAEVESETEAGYDLAEEWQKQVEYLPGTSGEAYMMMDAPVTSVHGVWNGDNQLFKKK